MSSLIAPSAATRRFLEEVHGLYIDGRVQVPSGTQPCNVYNPADGEQIGAFLPASVREADAAVQVARRAFRERRWMGLTPSARGQVLWRISEFLERDADEFAQIETLDCGKLLNAARCGDVVIAAESFRYH
ncbi:MAG TPA: aldehyde dehydrogenase family protein, partial [Steroidobacteraceae bacterium]|nr:aldehyde dehydrogenase family protein [Steroidobacteraceae bacterium]